MKYIELQVPTKAGTKRYVSIDVGCITHVILHPESKGYVEEKKGRKTIKKPVEIGEILSIYVKGGAEISLISDRMTPEDYLSVKQKIRGLLNLNY